jgi:hypothetical protein
MKNIRHSIVFFLVVIALPMSATAQPAALAELFSNFGCGNCAVPDTLYGAYLRTKPGVVLINYHNGAPYQSDQFYILSEPSSLDRNNFYGVSQDPTAIIDGFSAGATEGDWESFTTNEALANQLPGTITSSISHGPNNIDTIFFTITGSSSSQVAYDVAIKQSQIVYNNSQVYGNPPGNIWNDVFRVMLPGATGGTTFSLSGTHKFSVIFDPSKYNFTSDEQNMTAVIFAQDEKASSNNNYQIEAIDTISLAPSAGVMETTTPTTQLIVSANPLSSQGEIAFELAAAGDVRLSIFDMLGRQVGTLVQGMMPRGQTTVAMNGSMLPEGCYIAILTVDGRTADQAKFVFTP